MSFARITAFAVCALVATGSARAEDAKPMVQTLGSYSRVTFPVSPKSTFTVRQAGGDATQILLRFEGYGNAAWSELAGLRDERVKSVTLLNADGRSREVGIALAGQGLEFFAYFQPSPAAVIVDIWPRAKDEKAVAKALERKLASASPVARKEVAPKEVAPKKAEPSVPPLDRKTNFFHQFPVVTPIYIYRGANFDTVQAREISTGWEWTRPDIGKEGGVNFSLAQKLFGNKQYALVIKTVEFTRRDFPDGPYADEMDFLEALAYKRMGEAEKNKFLSTKAEGKLQELMLRNAKGGGVLPFASKIRIYFASEAYRQERWLDAISHFEFITSTNNADKEADYPGIVMAMAESYFKLRQYRRTERLYRMLMNKDPKSEFAKEAAYRLGNVYAHERAYGKADEALRRALREYPDYEHKRPEAYFNLAEANFWQGDAAKAEKNFRQFVEKHPSNPLGGYSYVRLGELAEILRGDTAKASDLYVTAVNRFPFSAGDTLGRIRQARLNVFREHDPAFQIDFLEKARAMADQPLEIRHMARETLIHYMNRVKRFSDAVQLSEAGMGEAEGTGFEIYKRLYIDSLRNLVADLNRQGKFDAVLALYKAKTDWLEQIGPEIDRELAAAYRGLGLIATSNRHLAKYLDAMEKQPKSRQPSSLIRDRDAALLTQARAEFLQGRFGAVLETLSGSSDPIAQSLKVRSLLRLERNDEAKRIAENALATLKLAKEPKGAERDELIIDFTEAVYAWAEARKEYKEMENALRAGINGIAQRYERFEYLLADAIWYQLKHRKAIEAYRHALEGAPNSSRADRARYRMAMSFIALGERMEAVNILTKLRDGSQNIWGESARQELGLLEWEKKYSVILGDLPPMGLGIEN